MTELETDLLILAASLFVGLMAMVALHLRTLIQTGMEFRRLKRERDLIKARLDYWVSGTGRE